MSGYSNMGISPGTSLIDDLETILLNKNRSGKYAALDRLLELRDSNNLNCSEQSDNVRTNIYSITSRVNKEANMGARGPHPRSNHIRVLEGEREDRINRDEPLPAEGEIVCPDDVTGEARRVWDSLAPDLIDKRVLRAWDVEAFAAYCRAVALFKEAAADVESNPLTIPGSHGGCVQNPAIRIMLAATESMIKLGGRFGLTPSDRAQLKVSDDGSSRSGAARLLG